MKIFKDRKAAGRMLAKRLKDIKANLVLGIPRGGVVVAYEVAKVLKLPLDVLVTRKIGAPMQEELALGAIDPDGAVVWDQALLDQLRIDKGELKIKIQNEWKELKRREELYGVTHARHRLARLEGKTVILVDDGVATGATTLAAIRYLKRHKAKVILAVPIASKSAWEKLSREADQVVILDIPDDFQAVGQFYHEFLPVSDQEVVQLLQGSRSPA